MTAVTTVSAWSTTGGAWSGTGRFVMAGAGDGGMMASMDVLTGEGGYEGLTLIMGQSTGAGPHVELGCHRPERPVPTDAGRRPPSNPIAPPRLPAALVPPARRRSQSTILVAGGTEARPAPWPPGPRRATGEPGPRMRRGMSCVRCDCSLVGLVIPGLLVGLSVAVAAQEDEQEPPIAAYVTGVAIPRPQRVAATSPNQRVHATRSWRWIGATRVCHRACSSSSTSRGRRVSIPMAPA